MADVLRGVEPVLCGMPRCHEEGCRRPGVHILWLSVGLSFWCDAHRPEPTEYARAVENERKGRPRDADGPGYRTGAPDMPIL